MLLEAVPLAHSLLQQRQQRAQKDEVKREDADVDADDRRQLRVQQVMAPVVSIAVVAVGP